MAKRKKETRKTNAKKKKKAKKSLRSVSVLPAFLTNELNEAGPRKKRR
jgi:hypothetical protein